MPGGVQRVIWFFPTEAEILADMDKWDHCEYCGGTGICNTGSDDKPNYVFCEECGRYT